MSEQDSSGFASTAQKPEGFKTSLFGFQKAEVLSYIEKLSGENSAAQKQLNEQIAALEEKLAAGESERGEVMEKVQEACIQLKEEQEHRKEAQAHCEKTEEELREMRERMMAREQELVMLRSEKSRAEERLAQMEETVLASKEKEKEVSAAIIGAQQAADSIVAGAKKEACAQKAELAKTAQDIGETVQRLKQELSQVENRIDLAFGAMRDATAEIELAVAQVDQRVDKLVKEAKREPENPKKEEPGPVDPDFSVPPLEEAVSDIAEKMGPTLHKLQELVLESINKLMGEK